MVNKTKKCTHCNKVQTLDKFYAIFSQCFECKKPQVEYSEEFLNSLTIEDNEEKRKKLFNNEKARKSKMKRKEANLLDNTITKTEKACKGILCNGAIRSISNFSRDVTTADKLQTICKDCKKQTSANKLALIEITDETTKKCIGPCGKILTLDNFPSNKQNYSGFGKHNICSDCRSDIRKEQHFEPETEGTKLCSFCKKDLDVNEFVIASGNSAGGRRNVCKKCHVKEKNISSSKNVDNFLAHLLNQAKTNAKRRKINFNLTSGELSRLYAEKDGKCALSGETMTYTQLTEREIGSSHILNPKNISIDRIDSSRGYIEDNIQLVCAIVNIIKYTLDKTELIGFCLDLDTHQIDKEYEQLVPTEYHTEISDDMKNRIKTKLSFTKGNAVRRNLKVKINEKQLMELYNKQRGRCALTGLELTCSNSRSDISIDRIDSNKDYTLDNIQLITELANNVKSDIETKELYTWANKIILFKS